VLQAIPQASGFPLQVARPFAGGAGQGLQEFAPVPQLSMLVLEAQAVPQRW
jgi:hypothetical protein